MTYHAHVIAKHGNVDRGRPPHVLSIDFSAVLHQQVDALEVAEACGVVEGRVAGGVGEVPVAALLEQERGYAGVPVHDGVVERDPFELVLGHDTGLVGLDQRLTELEVALKSSPAERRNPIRTLSSPSLDNFSVQESQDAISSTTLTSIAKRTHIHRVSNLPDLRTSSQKRRNIMRPSRKRSKMQSRAFS